jgi:hypothetical protein
VNPGIDGVLDALERLDGEPDSEPSAAAKPRGSQQEESRS